MSGLSTVAGGFVLIRFPYTFLALLLAFPGVSIACGFELVTPEMVAENRAKEAQLAKLTAKKSEFIFVGEVDSISAPTPEHGVRRVTFRVLEPLVGRPGETVVARWGELGPVPMSCDESRWFNIPQRIVGGTIYVVYAAADGHLLRASPMKGRSTVNLPAEEEKEILIGSGS